MNCKELFSKIQELNEKYISVWQDCCNIESPTDYKKGVDAVGEYFVNIAKARGWEIEYCRQEIAGDAIAVTMNPKTSGKPLVLSGHMDTVHPKGSFGSPAVRIEGDKIFGPGVCDCKGGIVASLLAMEALDECGYRKRPIILVLQSDEEKGSYPSKLETVRFMQKKAEGAVAFLNMEGNTNDEICIQRKGIINFRFIVHGIEAHSSQCCERGANAIAEAAHKILEIEKIKDVEGLTCCSSIISGGTVVNTVPGLCEFKVNVRFATAEQLGWIRGFMKDMADRVFIEGCKTELDEVSFRSAMEYKERNVELLEKLNGCFEKCGLPMLKGAKRSGGSDAAYITEAGIPCVDSIGVAGGKIHSPEEFGVIHSLADSAKRIVAAALYIED